MKTESAFRLSRIQAEGWNAARRLAVASVKAPKDSEIDALNPYSTGAARARWETGFRSALGFWR